jgi:hypothetical protein
MREAKVNVKVYAGSHQRALRKGSQLVLTLARGPSENIVMHKLVCEEQLMHNERVWDINHGQVHHSLLWALLLDDI